MVEDDPELAAMLTDLLTGEGYAVELARDGQRGLHLGLTREFDLMLLDRGLPAIDGLDLLGRLRARGRYVPTLVLSALGQPRDRVDGLDAGAEDYLGKPFDVDELLARLRALLRRPRDHADVLHVPGGELDLSTPVGGDRVRRRGRAVRARGDAALGARPQPAPGLHAGASWSDSVFEAAEDEGVVDTYVHYLRRKLHRGVVETVRGLGYRLGTR